MATVTFKYHLQSTYKAERTQGLATFVLRQPFTGKTEKLLIHTVHGSNCPTLFDIIY